MTMRLVDALAAERGDSANPLVHLVGWPYITQHGAPFHIAEGGARLPAFLALNRGAEYPGAGSGVDTSSRLLVSVPVWLATVKEC